MIKQLQKQALAAQKADETTSMSDLQQQLLLLNNLKRELSKNLRDRIFM
jgi:hypothetical protein